MPVISMFFGIIIRLFFKDNKQHNTPHIHAEYQGNIAVFTIPEGTILEGTMHQERQNLFLPGLKFIGMADWHLAVHGESVFKIKGLE